MSIDEDLSKALKILNTKLSPTTCFHKE